MDSQKNNGMCRCCASEGTFKDVKTAYQWMGEEEVYADMLRECLDISLCADVTGDVEGGICEVCITQLRNASNFKKQVLHTEDQFKRRLQEGLFKSDIVKVEVPTVDEDSDNDNNLSEDFSGTEFEVPVKTESVEEPKAKKRTAKAKASTSRVKKMKAEDGETSKREPRVTVKIERDNDDWHVAVVKTERESVRKVPISPKPVTGTKTRKSPVNKTKRLSNTIKIQIELDEEQSGAETGTDVNKAISEKQHIPSKKLKMETKIEKQNANIKAILTYSNATPVRTHLDTGYACCLCKAAYPDPADLKLHNLKHSDISQVIKKVRAAKMLLKLDITALNCNICQESIDSLENLIQHLKDIHEKVVYVDVHNQIVPFKFDSECLRCHICFKIFTKFKMLLQHMNQHFKNYVCEICGEGFLNQMSFKKHNGTHQVGPHRCSRCPQVFDTLQKKRLHEHNDHRLDLRYKCGYCTEKFTTHRRKVMHLAEQHGISPITFDCYVCGKSFEGQFLMNAHVRRVHMMEKSHACAFCNMSFFNFRELDQHMVKHTGAREFQCDVCLKTFGRKKTLRQHLRIHENDRRFQCVHCNQGYVQKRDWRRHMLSVHGETI